MCTFISFAHFTALLFRTPPSNEQMWENIQCETGKRMKKAIIKKNWINRFRINHNAHQKHQISLWGDNNFKLHFGHPTGRHRPTKKYLFIIIAINYIFDLFIYITMSAIKTIEKPVIEYNYYFYFVLSIKTHMHNWVI